MRSDYTVLKNDQKREISQSEIFKKYHKRRKLTKIKHMMTRNKHKMTKKR